MIATLATQAADEGIDVVVVTGDRDTYQLVHDPHLKVLYNKRGVSDYALYDEAGILERTGVTPEQYVEYAALRGDPSDNLPGVPGIGEKTAAKLVSTYGDARGDLRARRRAAAEAAPEPHRVPRSGCCSTGRCRSLRRDVDVGVRAVRAAPGRLRQGAGPRPLRPARVPHPPPARAGGRRRGGRRDDAEAETIEADVEVLRDPSAIAARLDEVRAAGARYALEPRWEGVPVTQSARSASRWPTTRAASPTSTARPSAILRSPRPERAARARRSAARRPPGQGADARARALDVRSARHDTAVMAYLLDPGEGKYDLEELALRYLALEVAVARRRGRARSTSTATPPPTRPAGAPSPSSGSPTPSPRRSTPASSTDLYERSSDRSCGCSRRWSTPASGSTGVPRRAARRAGQGSATTSSARSTRIAGEPFDVNSTPQLRVVLFEKLELTPVKKTKTGPSTDADSLQKMARGPPDRRGPPALPRGREAPLDVRRRAPAAHRPRRPHPRDLQPDRHDHRPHLERERRTCRTSRCGRPTGVRCAARSSPTRAPACSPPTTRRSSCASSRTWPRTRASSTRSNAALDVHTVTAAKVFDVDEAKVDASAAPVREGRQLRPRLRDGGVRPRAAARHPDRPGARDPRQLLRGVPQRPRVHGAHGQGGQAARLHDDDLRAAPPDHRARRPTTSASARWGSGWRRTRRSRVRRPTSSSSP